MRHGSRRPPAGEPGRFGRLLHLGNVVVDVVLAVPALPERGGDVLAGRAETAAGGGFNVLAAAARQGLRTAYAGAHGTGPFATLARAALASEGVDVIQPAKAGLDTGFVLTLVEASGERTFVTSRGAEATLTAADLDRVNPAARDAVYLSGYSLVHDSNRAALLGWLPRLGGGNLMFFDPGPLVGAIPAGALATVLDRADWLTCNAREAAILTGAADPRAAAATLAGRASRSQVLVRTGPDGCLIGRPGAGVVHVPGFAVRVRDTNGAGDAHTGVFIAALAAGAAGTAAARSANAAAALAVTRRGPATAPTQDELARFLATA
ncbi:MAG TPA: PfkB family carbohydrate kinase [Streptosporangiaceae bacterium]|nr:PfkB family carbohydrate kinase [Streptosporangiaceae bacterium]